MDPAQAPSTRPGLGARLRDLLVGTPGQPKNLDPKMLSVDRTRLSHERTMMSWIRTGLSMISFGFTIYKFFQLQDLHLREGLIGAREFALVMISIGLLALVFAGLQHRRELQRFRAAGIELAPSLAGIIAALVGLLGVLGLLAVLFRQ